MKRGDLSKGLPPDGLSGGRYSRPRPAKDFDGTSEPDLIDAALKRDIEAFAHLFERYRPDLYGLCLRRLKDSSLAEDVVQDVFIRAFKNLPSFDHSKPFWPWLATIAVRMCIDLQRHRSLTQYSEDIGVSLDAESHRQSKTVLDETIASEERAQLQGWLSTLPKRQRRALLLHVWDGWSYADIGAAEGISSEAARLLVVRARQNMRMRADRPLGAIAFPFTWLRWKLQRFEERIRAFPTAYGEGLANACVHAICLGTLAMVVAGASHPARSLEPEDQIRSVETIASPAQSRPLETSSLTIASMNGYASAGAPVQSQPSAVGAAESLVDRMVNRNQYATPENRTLYSIAASPNYENDHMVVAAGQGHVVFVSQDGGASWKPQVSRLPNLDYQRTLVFSPGYLQDRRIFTLGEFGLQQSDDGGEIFKPVSPVSGFGLAISPSFGKKDSKLWIGTTAVFEYDADTGVTQPARFPIPTRLERFYRSIVFSPGYPADSTVFLTSESTNTDYRTILYRCEGLVCDEIQFSTVGPLKLRLSPQFSQDGVAYAFARNLGKHKLFVSKDGGRTFRDLEFPVGGSVVDMDVLWNGSSEPDILTYVYHKISEGVYRSVDGGRSWNNGSSSKIDLPDFVAYGINQLIVTPTGRLLITGGRYGVGCSEDLGQNWAPRCPPEP